MTETRRDRLESRGRSLCGPAGRGGRRCRGRRPRADRGHRPGDWDRHGATSRRSRGSRACSCWSSAASSCCSPTGGCCSSSWCLPLGCGSTFGHLRGEGLRAPPIPYVTVSDVLLAIRCVVLVLSLRGTVVQLRVRLRDEPAPMICGGRPSVRRGRTAGGWSWPGLVVGTGAATGFAVHPTTGHDLDLCRCRLGDVRRDALLPGGDAGLGDRDPATTVRPGGRPCSGGSPAGRSPRSR